MAKKKVSSRNPNWKGKAKNDTLNSDGVRAYAEKLRKRFLELQTLILDSADTLDLVKDKDATITPIVSQAERLLDQAKEKIEAQFVGKSRLEKLRFDAREMVRQGQNGGGF